MSLGSDVLADVIDVISELGEPFTATQTTEGTYSTDTLTTASGTTVSYSGNCAPDSYKSFEIDGTNIQINDSILYLTSTTVPKIGDNITFNSTVYRVINVELTRLTGVTVLYKLQVRV